MPFGFCHLNGIGVAIAAAWERAAAKGEPRPRVAILDVDVHHGNANEDTFWTSGDVLHVNLNERGIWPGPEHGDPTAVGQDAGLGANLNFPMPPGEGDAAYVYTLLQHALPAIEEFKPALIIVACGLDAIRGDPYASMNVSPFLFGWLAAELRERRTARVVFNLEGGYSPAACTVAVYRAIEGLTCVSAESFLGIMGLLPEPGAVPAGGSFQYRGVQVAAPRAEVQAEIDAARDAQLTAIARARSPVRKSNRRS